MFTSNPIPGNVDLRARDFHGEPYYDIPAFQRLDEADQAVLIASIHNAMTVLLSPGCARVLPYYNIPGSAESVGAPAQH